MSFPFTQEIFLFKINKYLGEMKIQYSVQFTIYFENVAIYSWHELSFCTAFFFSKSTNKASGYLYPNFVMKLICFPILILPDLCQGGLRNPEAKVSPGFEVERAGG